MAYDHYFHMLSSFVTILLLFTETFTMSNDCVVWWHGFWNSGVYPLAAVPYELQASTNGAHKLLPESLSAQVKAAVDNLRIGFSRIVRLCKCISQVMQSLSTWMQWRVRLYSVLAFWVFWSVCWFYYHIILYL